ncbi:hypothetical protein OHB26_22745 [Nocardia sp. NBC_01503]|uniref:terpene synthase family protein n=1 Tax=Nocardia sp. NBC_01503 TaxID=2975997 RepID=UPI002E7B22F2|nr:hypothetical protein [Nocardia sp. NBC_01503]WTL29787.1 hypothetical protein OHB26_22745 [Nocardia sp. NBC_01503]
MTAVGNQELWCPVQRSVHPMLASIEAASLAWLDAYEVMAADLRAEFRAGSPGALGSYTYPRGTLEGTRLASDFITWLFAFDDLYCDANRIGSDPVEFSAIIGEMIEVLEAPGAAVPELPIARALRDLHRRVREMGSPVQQRRWTDETEKYLLAKLWEAGRRRAKSLPPLDSYVHMRRLGGANVACLMLTDVSLGCEVSAEVMCGREMAELVKAAADLADLDNDLLSYARESGPGEEFPINGVAAARLHGARDIATAVESVLTYRDARMRTLLEMSAHFAELVGSPAADFSRGVCDWVGGHIEWIMKSGRYSRASLDLRPTVTE